MSQPLSFKTGLRHDVPKQHILKFLMETIFLDHVNESARLLEGSSLKCLSTAFVSDPERASVFIE